MFYKKRIKELEDKHYKLVNRVRLLEGKLGLRNEYTSEALQIISNNKESLEKTIIDALTGLKPNTKVISTDAGIADEL